MSVKQAERRREAKRREWKEAEEAIGQAESRSEGHRARAVAARKEYEFADARASVAELRAEAAEKAAEAIGEDPGTRDDNGNRDTVPGYAWDAFDLDGAKEYLDAKRAERKQAKAAINQAVSVSERAWARAFAARKNVEYRRVQCLVAQLKAAEAAEKAAEARRLEEEGARLP